MTRKLTPDQLDEIEAAAKKATPGPWRQDGTGIDGGKYDEVISPGQVYCMSYCYGGSSTIDGDNLDADMAHIVNMNPATTLALVAEVRELRAKVERVRVQAQQVLNKHSDGPYGFGAADQAYLTIKALGEKA